MPVRTFSSPAAIRRATAARVATGRAMRRGSPWLERLARDEGSGWRVPMVSIYSCHDNLVAPQDSCRLDHAVNVPLAAIGHLTLPFSRRVRTALAHAIEQIVK